MKIRYYSHAHLTTGYGRAALDLIMALDRAHVRLEAVTMGPRPPDVPWPIPGDLCEPIPDPDVVIVHTLPGDCHRVLETEGLKRGAGPKLVAYTTWEALTAPEQIVQPLYDSFDEVWTPSQASARALGANGLHGSGRDRESAERRTRVIPHCYDSEAVRPSDEYFDTGKFRCYWIGAWSARKNPGGLIRAFASVFYPDSRAELVLHSPGTSMDVFVAALAQTGMSQRELPKIILSNQQLAPSALAALHQQADCFVTAARGEAWNLPAFDAMLAGRHVISQYGLGSDEFLVDTSADLIDGVESPSQVDVKFASADDGSLTVKTVGAQGLTSRSLWLEPNLCSLATAMRHASDARLRNIEINYDVAARFGYAAVANQVVNVLEKL